MFELKRNKEMYIFNGIDIYIYIYLRPVDIIVAETLLLLYTSGLFSMHILLHHRNPAI